jgi:hypothetical protein
MIPCSSNDKTCHNHNYVCIRHPLCDYRSLCYPLNKATYEICSSFNKIFTTSLFYFIQFNYSKNSFFI